MINNEFLYSLSLQWWWMANQTDTKLWWTMCRWMALSWEKFFISFIEYTSQMPKRQHPYSDGPS